MASHGVPRSATKQQRTQEAREKELKEIEQYRALVDSVHEHINADNLGPDLLDQTTALLEKNPEYYTIWNIRRRIYAREIASLREQVVTGSLEESKRQSQVLDLINSDLKFLLPLLLQYPKCYWIWNHRAWLLEQASGQLPSETARSLWEHELGLISTMLTRDSRNFHGWGYRATVVSKLESRELNGQSMTRSEYEYTTKKIGEDLSNFSAWHMRSRLILRMLNEAAASDQERREMLDSEIELIHKALFDPYDQSLWFYHQHLMCSFDPDTCGATMAPNLSTEEKLTYIDGEEEYIQDLVEDAEDCKWVYLALLDCASLRRKLGKGIPSEESMIRQWLSKIEQLDPLRAGRWADMQQKLLGDR